MKKQKTRSRRARARDLSNAMLLISFLSVAMAAPMVHAEENTGEKIEMKAKELNKNAKKKMRKAKKKARDASGKSSLKQDVKDAAHNTGDEIDYQADSLKNKVD